MQTTFYERLKDTQILDSTNNVLLAVSGGVDSMVLLDLMQNLPPGKKPQLSIAHVNHQLRSESDEEELFMRDYAAKENIPFYRHEWAKERHPTAGIEEAARMERYTFFRQTMEEHGIDYLMTGHHLDDQVETVLMRLTRGASLEQLLGIEPSQVLTLNGAQGSLIRPLLPFTKEELYAYAHENNLPFVEDATNQETDFTRNRFRQVILPLLKEENQRFNEHIEQFTADLADLLAIAQAPIHEAYRKLVQVDAGKYQLNVNRFITYPKAMQRAVIKEILEHLYEDRLERYKTNHIDLVRNWLLEGEVNTSLDLVDPFNVKKGYTEAVFLEKTEIAKQIKKPQATEKIIDQVGEWVELSETEAIGLFVKEDATEEEADELLIAAENLHLPLRIRHRQPGDRMRYKGLPGRKKISDIFIDDKTPPKARDEAWLVEDANGQIIWLISHRKMDLFTDAETDKLVYGLSYTTK